MLRYVKGKTKRVKYASVPNRQLNLTVFPATSGPIRYNRQVNIKNSSISAVQMKSVPNGQVVPIRECSNRQVPLYTTLSEAFIFAYLLT